MEASSTYVMEKRSCVGARKGSHGMVDIRLSCFGWLSGETRVVSERGRGATGW